jgi:SAM-dependent methyltransferase
MDLKEVSLLGSSKILKHWYYRAKLAALLRATADVQPCSVLDVGAGSGFFSRSLLKAGRATKVICVDTGYAEDYDDVVAGHRILFRRALASQDSDVGLVIMMDVLEHVDDDIGLVHEYANVVPPGTQFVITVPAFQWLWSGHDVFLGHRRRYSLPQIEQVLRTAGLHIEFGSYYFGSVLPVAAAFRFWQRMTGNRTEDPKSEMRLFGPLLNTLFWNACRAELPLLRINRVAGLSVFVRAVKPL